MFWHGVVFIEKFADRVVIAYFFISDTPQPHKERKHGPGNSILSQTVIRRNDRPIAANAICSS